MAYIHMNVHVYIIVLTGHLEKYISMVSIMKKLTIVYGWTWVLVVRRFTDSWGINYFANIPLQWRHNELDSVSNHQPHDCLLNRLFRRRSKKTSKLRVTGLYVGNSPVTGEFPAQRASNAENVSIWWRHLASWLLHWDIHVMTWPLCNNGICRNKATQNKTLTVLCTLCSYQARVVAIYKTVLWSMSLT